jgi:hypothetical protein
MQFNLPTKQRIVLSPGPAIQRRRISPGDDIMAQTTYCVDAEAYSCIHKQTQFSGKYGRYVLCKANNEECTYNRGPGYVEKIFDDKRK